MSAYDCCSNIGKAKLTKTASAGRFSSLFALPGIAFAMLPALVCPACWPAYAGLLSSLGVTFLADEKYLYPLTVFFLSLAVAALLWRARKQRKYSPFIIGTVGASLVVLGKFSFDNPWLNYLGIALLIGTSLWNAWPKRVGVAASSPAGVAPPQPKAAGEGAGE